MNDNPVRSLWNDEEASRCRGDLGLRVYTSRLLGRDKSLVLHGGGNTSVKVREKNILGEEEDLLYIKGSGWDLETIEEAGFAPVRLPHLLRLAGLKTMTDSQMSNELLTHLTRASAPAPSVETILHALLPSKYVDHTHADAFISISNTRDGRKRIGEVYGDSVVYIPYIMPGFDLSRLCAEIFPREKTAKTIGMALEHHGLFSFGETARESYERMIGLVAQAEDYLRRNKAWQIAFAPRPLADKSIRQELAGLRYELSGVAGFPVLLLSRADERSLAFAQRDDLAKVSQQGPATPDHVIRTKRVPLLGRDGAAYTKQYRAYFDELAPQARPPLKMLDPAPRIVIDPAFGVAAVGRSAKDAAIAHDIYAHTMDIIARAELLGGWAALPAKDIFDVEYWELEQAKLAKSGRAPVFAGEVAVVTGAASGIGKACVDSLLQRGAAVVGLDIDPKITSLHQRPDFLGIACDLTNETAIGAALEQAVRGFGGLDLLVLNAGIFPKGCAIGQLDTETWRRVMAINLDSNLVLLREAHSLLKLAPQGGRVVVIGSKNVPAPGPGAAAYSASKAALNQLVRVAALEWGGDRIRLNSIHPNAVFDTALWSEEVLQSRAKAYGLSVDDYKRNNLLHAEITSRDVAELAAEMCGPLFAKTTAAQVPLDGGNERVV
jgi:rhamnose utilization protein RhaD (predicted bifunctional aldolase and dehydrogenase)/NAD(P)-dependent dehydrogenase (short-subunit alcohol dehydrogenase family)